jgi:hypothetical protein
MLKTTTLTANEDGRCVLIAFEKLGIETDVIEEIQARAPLHTQPYPLWCFCIQQSSRGKLQPHLWTGGLLSEFAQQHPVGKYLVIVLVPEGTHAVAVSEGTIHNASNIDRPVFRVWTVKP